MSKGGSSGSVPYLNGQLEKGVIIVPSEKNNLADKKKRRLCVP